MPTGRKAPTQAQTHGYLEGRECGESQGKSGNGENGLESQRMGTKVVERQGMGKRFWNIREWGKRSGSVREWDWEKGLERFMKDLVSFTFYF